MSVLDYVMGMKSAGAGGGSTGGIIEVNIIYDEKDSCYRFDKTFGEISEAFKNGRTIIAHEYLEWQGEPDVDHYATVLGVDEMSPSVAFYYFDNSKISRFIASSADDYPHENTGDNT